jgi:hypothetical protein
MDIILRDILYKEKETVFGNFVYFTAKYRFSFLFLVFQILRCLLRNLYSSAIVIRVIKSRRGRWVGHVARMREMRICMQYFSWKTGRKRPLGRSRPNGKIILEWIVGKLDGEVWTGFIWLRIGTSGGLL